MSVLAVTVVLKGGEAMIDKQTRNVNAAWILGSNCIAYEKRPGPARINIGSVDRPLWVTRNAAVQATLIQRLVLEVDGDAGLLREAAEVCRTRIAVQGATASGSEGASRGLDLCERALRLLQDTGADQDDGVRRRLVAQCRHDVTMALFGSSAEMRVLEDILLRAELDAIDEEPTSPMQVLAEPIPYPGPSYDPTTGHCVTGVDAEGNTTYWRLHTPGHGVEPGVIVGPRRSGKSTLVANLLLAALHSGVFQMILADPSGRGQLPGPFGDVCFESAEDVTGTLRLLWGVEAIVRERSTAGGYQDPTRERPGILVVIEECHHVFTVGAHATRIAEAVATGGGSAGVSLIVTAPGADLAYFGGSGLLRGALARSGNGVVFGGPDALGEFLELRDAARKAASPDADPQPAHATDSVSSLTAQPG